MIDGLIVYGDTEATGLNPEIDRLCEIAFVEYKDGFETGDQFHHYLNPERPIPAEATAIHQITDEMVRDKPTFATIVPALLSWLNGRSLVLHNASYDLRILNAHLQRAGKPPLANPITDTLELARRLYPGRPASLDALAKRFGIDLEARRRLGHGALLDAKLLQQIHLEMAGGTQRALILDAATIRPAEQTGRSTVRRTPRIVTASPTEIEAHSALLATMSAPVWLKPRT